MMFVYGLNEGFALIDMRKSRGPGEESSYFLPTLEQKQPLMHRPSSFLI